MMNIQFKNDTVPEKNGEENQGIEGGKAVNSTNSTESETSGDCDEDVETVEKYKVVIKPRKLYCENPEQIELILEKYAELNKIGIISLSINGKIYIYNT